MDKPDVTAIVDTTSPVALANVYTETLYMALYLVDEEVLKRPDFIRVLNYLDPVKNMLEVLTGMEATMEPRVLRFPRLGNTGKDEGQDG